MKRTSSSCGAAFAPIAQERGFDTFAAAALTTATSELTRNVWVHARRGTATIEQLSDGTRFGDSRHLPR